ncbi:MAG: hypothetical protein IKB02_07410 [Clostridia bacterium]|nr:hypothetical protein [Clostridia bacterium]
MKAGFARLDITPPFGTNLVGYFHQRPADDIITPLYVNAVVVDDGERRAALITLDAEGATAECTATIREYTSEMTGLDPDSIFISCIHTHQGIGLYSLNGFNNIVKTRVADAVQLAIYDLHEAKAYVARAEAKGVAFIRLYRMKDGSTKTNPGMPSKDKVLAPIGTPDETAQLIKFKREGASDIAIVNFQMHPDVIGGTKICHDWPGFVRTYLEAALNDEADGKGVKAICFNGAQGDTAHIDRTRLSEGILPKWGGVAHSKHIARVIVGALIGAYTYAKEVNSDKVFYKRQPVIINSATKPTPEQLEIAYKVRDAYNAGVEKAKAEGRSEWDGGNEAVKDFPFGLVPARRFISLSKEPDTYTLYLSSVGFGDVCFVGFPGEPFTEIGRQTKARSPFEMTFTCCMTNGQEGYFPMKEVFGEVNGYEASATRFEVGTAEKFIEAAVALTEELKAENPTPAAE